MRVNKVEDANVVAHARLWVFNNIIITKIKGCKFYLDPPYTIHQWDIGILLVALVQAHASRANNLTWRRT
jgi:adenine-specific DNA methylase